MIKKPAVFHCPGNFLTILPYIIYQFSGSNNKSLYKTTVLYVYL